MSHPHPHRELLDNVQPVPPPRKARWQVLRCCIPPALRRTPVTEQVAPSTRRSLHQVAPSRAHTEALLAPCRGQITACCARRGPMSLNAVAPRVLLPSSCSRLHLWAQLHFRV